MTFLLDDEQREFGRTLDRMLGAADIAGAVRAWAVDDTGPGRKVWQRLADLGVFALAVPEEHAGSGFLPVELAVAFVELGRHGVPGPVVETVAAAALLRRLGDPAPSARWLPGIAAGSHLVSYADTYGETDGTAGTDGTGEGGHPGGNAGGGRGPYALDAHTADTTFVVAGDRLLRATGHGPVQPSLDPARRLARPAYGGEVLASGPAVRAASRHAVDVAAFLTAAQALGAGRRLLADTVTYVRQRKQFGVAVGSFQAVRHRLADALVALEFAQPLVFGAAVALAAETGADEQRGRAVATEGAGRAAAVRREVAAAKVAAGEAAYGAARAALQLHGAIGYTDELDLSLWIRKARALRTAWGTPSECRARVLAGQNIFYQ
ncbi:acyl-CoA dehydrogenase family protein [Streptomyces celluloflavus]|uniref:acyl-CoA dehydrogenase family protein n=1 Tax=Streptomyces celluloflavus TaxID=58344 RepID=UPI00345FC9C3|nr:acyl-CoA/acyl-ACP dehydrogenase [Streptomyces celluloflavus]